MDSIHDRLAFINGYIECALWAEHDNSDPETGGEPFDANYDASDIAPETLARMQDHCRAFMDANRDALACACAHDGYDAGRAGFDFWLTRNGHGAGFWDRGLGICGEALTRASKAAGAFTLYVGDDGLIYGMEG